MTPIAPLITAFLREHMPIERGFTVPTPAKRMLMRSVCCLNSPLAAWE
jgi:hypothetical protein